MQHNAINECCVKWDGQRYGCMCKTYLQTYTTKSQDKTHHTGRVCLTYNCMAFAKTLARKRERERGAHTQLLVCAARLCLCIKYVVWLFWWLPGIELVTSGVIPPWCSSRSRFYKTPLASFVCLFIGPPPTCSVWIQSGGAPRGTYIIYSHANLLSPFAFSHAVGFIWCRVSLVAGCFICCSERHPSMCRLIGSLIQFMRPNAPTCAVFGWKGCMRFESAATT